MRTGYAPFSARFARGNGPFAHNEAMSDLGAVIAEQLRAWGTTRLPNEQALFGTEDPATVAAMVDGWCRAHLGSPIARYRFFDSSSASVHGVELADGRAVVVKGHRPGVSTDFLRAMTAVQRGLARTGFPAPDPLVDPQPCGGGHLGAETLLARSRPADAHAPGIRRVLARGLVRFQRQAAPHHDTLADVRHPMAEPVDGAWYPAPHSTRFDFAATANGAGWIDGLARSAREHLERASPTTRVVSHGDWRVQNVSIRDGAIDAVYDWDSVAVTDECTALGTAAITFGVDWSVDQPRRFSTAAEMGAFLADYEDARGVPLAATDRDRLAASMVASLAYGARCEHADPERPPAGTDSQRTLLRTLGPALLTHGLEVLSG